MTPEREEKLISDTAETKALLGRFLGEWDELKPKLATLADVACVDVKLDRHIADTAENKKYHGNLWPAWIAAIGSAAAAIIAIIVKK